MIKRFKLGLMLGVLGGIVALTGCATPETRIQKNPEVFARLTPRQQDLIKQGQAGVGFDPEMVKLALGEPDRIVTRTDAQGTTEIWSYQIYDSSDGVLLYRGYYHRYYVWGDPFYPYYLSYAARRTREQLKVVFDVTGKVASIEQVKR